MRLLLFLHVPLWQCTSSARVAGRDPPLPVRGVSRCLSLSSPRRPGPTGVLAAYFKQCDQLKGCTHPPPLRPHNVGRCATSTRHDWCVGAGGRMAPVVAPCSPRLATPGRCGTRRSKSTASASRPPAPTSTRRSSGCERPFRTRHFSRRRGARAMRSRAGAWGRSDVLISSLLWS